MIDRKETFGMLTKNMAAMGGTIAPKCAKLFTMLGHKVQRIEEEIKDVRELKSEAAFLTIDAEMRLSAMIADLASNNFLRAGDIRAIIKQEFEGLKDEDFDLSLTWFDRLEIYLIGFIGAATFAGLWAIYG